MLNILSILIYIYIKVNSTLQNHLITFLRERKNYNITYVLITTVNDRINK